MAPKKERDEALNDFSSRIFSAMMEEVLMDVVLQSHRENARFNAVCDVCHTRCNSAHNPGSSTAIDGGVYGSQHHKTDNQTILENGAASGPGTGANTPNANGNVYFDCTNCGRQIASNRYAPHLSGCMGLGSSRRGAARTSTTKAKLDAATIAAAAGRSGSPYVGSDLGNISDDSKATTKSKGKSRSKQADDAEFSLHRKRIGSPSVSPVKKTKKPKTAPSVSRVKTESDLAGPSVPHPLSHTNSHSKIPSRLRETSVLSYDRRSSSPDSQFSSPAQSASTPSAFSSLQSPVLAGAGIPGRPKAKNGTSSLNGGGGSIQATMRFSPQPPPPPVVRGGAEDYFVDVEGEETGSSTDSDSD